MAIPLFEEVSLDPMQPDTPSCVQRANNNATNPLSARTAAIAVNASRLM
jgi:hypothetical protein